MNKNPLAHKVSLASYLFAHIMRLMNALKHIRKNVFGVTQQEFATIAGVQQSMVSRWENGVTAPTLEEMNRIRAEAEARRAARRLKAKWDDRLFFAEAAA